MPSVADVQKINVTNRNPAQISIALIRDAASFPLSPTLEHDAVGTFDLTTVLGLIDHDAFSVRVIVPHTGANAPDTTVLTYVPNAGAEAIYIVDGTAIAPSITYKGTKAF